MKLTTKIPITLAFGIILCLLVMQHIQIGRLWLALARMAELQAEAAERFERFERSLERPIVSPETPAKNSG